MPSRSLPRTPLASVAVALPVAALGLWSMGTVPTPFALSWVAIALLGAWVLPDVAPRWMSREKAFFAWGVLLSTPALGAGVMQREIAFFDAAHVLPSQGLTLSLLFAGTVGTAAGPPLLLAGALLGWTARRDLGRPIATRILAGAWFVLGAASWVAGALDVHAMNLLGTMPSRAAWCVLLGGVATGTAIALAVVLAALGWRRSRLSALVPVLAGFAAFLVHPPAERLLADLPDPAPIAPLSSTVPEAEVPGPPLVGPVWSADPVTLEAALRETGHSPIRGPLYPVLPRGKTRRWEDVARMGVVLAIPGAASVAGLEEPARVLATHGAWQLALVERAPRPAPGILGRMLSWPSAVFLLDRPPEDVPSARVALTGDDPSPALPIGVKTCVVDPGEGLTVAQLTRQWHALRSACPDGIGLHFPGVSS